MKLMLQLLYQYTDRVDLLVEYLTDTGILYFDVYASLSEHTGYVKVKGEIPYVPSRVANGQSVRLSLMQEEIQKVLPGVTLAGNSLFLKALPVNFEGEDVGTLEDSPIKSLGASGVRRTSVADNPMKSAQLAGLSLVARGWVPGSASALGAQSVSSVPFYEDEFVIKRTFIAEGKVGTELIYLKSDPIGARAMLITYSDYSGNVPGKVEYTHTVKS